MSKVSALQASLEKTSGKATPSIAHSPASPPSTAPAAAGAYKAPSREGKVHIGAYLHPNFKRSLRLVQAQTGEDVQTLVTRALNDLFAAHNVPVVDQE
jgi:succinylarginine dihydrolase